MQLPGDRNWLLFDPNIISKNGQVPYTTNVVQLDNQLIIWTNPSNNEVLNLYVCGINKE